ncbi:hypothetical protein F5884DRAFT_854524 [Xylogone sp. PMI_703]|nr:hypothetical protein F5884DRAFT_854524 [Xylogone sp. PMI_703]
MSTSSLGSPFATVNGSDRGGLLWIAAALSLTYFSLSGILRIFISLRSFHRDAAMLVLGSIFAFIQVMIVFKQLDLGFGKSQELLRGSQSADIEKAGYAADIFFILSLCFAKCSVALFIGRLSPAAKHQYMCSALFWFSILWGMSGVLALSLRCDLSHPWVTLGAKCSNFLLRWKIIVAFDVITEAALFLLTVALVWRLHMPTQKKQVVVLGFAFRLPLVVFAILHVHSFGTIVHSTNPSYDQIIPSVYVQIEMGWSLISATIPCLKGFVVDLGTGYLGHNLGTTALGYGSNRYPSERDTYMLDTITASRATRSKVTAGQADNLSNRSLTRASQSNDHELDENGIRRTVDYRVEYD